MAGLSMDRFTDTVINAMGPNHESPGAGGDDGSDLGTCTISRVR